MGRIAAALNRTENQVLQRWKLQHGVGILQGSTKPARIADNMAVFDFELEEAHTRSLDELNVEFPLYYDVSFHEKSESSFTCVLIVVVAPLLALACTLMCL